MVRASCHCGAVVLDVAEAPREVTDCNCSICRRYGVLWAYYRPEQVEVRADNATNRYLTGERSIAFHRCGTCGCVTHWSASDPARDRMAVNARLMPPDILSRARVRRLDGAVTWRYLD
ncbi:GFA family protein [Marinivivus vitaminiproducens]|uniref:GFA family protein n=1 Tax=Marinivivus vitaminiproducens TaxID=3035935 RepID=UPI0027A3A6A4|nr:hypothetical protein P4R82_06835 [Geminicoccaceae bacterium SCSIO 64248]